MSTVATVYFERELAIWPFVEASKCSLFSSTERPPTFKWHAGKTEAGRTMYDTAMSKKDEATQHRQPLFRECDRLRSYIVYTVLHTTGVKFKLFNVFSTPRSSQKERATQ